MALDTNDIPCICCKFLLLLLFFLLFFFFFFFNPNLLHPLHPC